ncbi:FAD/NAD(P)-binding protein [Paucibacter soli]|uniref:FAD/NAD(P)-binding protein n=1 Tax=Paucibacter soli TaxID=3133433 RepID=UPI0030A78B10
MHIAVIGAGFSGASLVYQLLRRSPAGNRISIINASGRYARGLAYGTSSDSHVLNVPAARMSLDEARSDDFISWLRSQGNPHDAHQFVSRRLYGDYLAARLDEAIASRRDMQVTRYDQAVAELLDHQQLLRLADGTVLKVDQVILALGHFAPTSPLPALGHLPPKRYVNDPWSANALQDLPPDASLLLLGTGLTMVDTLLSLRKQGHEGRILALSRRGLPPLAHRRNELPPTAWQPRPDWVAAPHTPVKLLRALRAEAAKLRAVGGDWRDLWVGLRSQTPQLWAGLSMRQRAQFLRHAQVYWDVHRHRAAPDAITAVQAALDTGQLQVAAGRLVAVEPCVTGLRLAWRPRHASALQQFEAVRVINCTGPSASITADTCPLLWRLAEQGRLQRCPLGLGIHVDEQYRLLDEQGHPQDGLHYIGPLLKAQFWEATAVPELRLHAARLAQAILST